MLAQLSQPRRGSTTRGQFTNAGLPPSTLRDMRAHHGTSQDRTSRDHQTFLSDRLRPIRSHGSYVRGCAPN
eukprot:14293299-Alexandrium_andersonii.AAC.1